MKKFVLILNIAAGKEKTIPIPNVNYNEIETFTVNIDSCYYSELTENQAEKYIDRFLEGKTDKKEIYLSCNVFQFLERTRHKFDFIHIYRFLEHVSFTNLNYFIYLISTVTERNAMVDVIVPNYKILAEMIIDEDNHFMKNGKATGFEDWNITLTTELLNEPSCPHASIWTDTRAKYFWELEKRFKVNILSSSFNFDGRYIYLRFLATRI